LSSITIIDNYIKLLL